MKLAVLFILLFSFAPLRSATVPSSEIEAYFSPHGGCSDAIVQKIASAHNDIFIQAYSFTSSPIAESIIEAKKRGLNVQIILDKSQRTERYSCLEEFLQNEVPTYIDAVHHIAHNKIIIIDENTVITGSFNFTKSAEEWNAENLLIIKSPKLSSQYIENWKHHLAHSTVAQEIIK